MAWAVGRPARQPAPSWWTAQLGPGAWPLLTATLLLTVTAAVLYVRPRRRQGRAAGLLVAGALAVSGGLLGLLSYWPCAGQEPPGVAPLSWTLGLYVGSAEARYGPGLACAGVPPLALTAARLLCLSAALLGVVSLAALLWRRQMDLARARAARSLTIVVGLDAASIEVVRVLAGRGVVWVVEPDETRPGLEECREAGARVVVADPSSERALSPVITWFGRPALRAAYLLDPDSAANERTSATVKSVLARVRAPEVRAELLVRHDDPRQAAERRGGCVVDDPRWIEDAVSAVEITAQSVVTGLLEDGSGTDAVQRVLVCGDTPMSNALLAELVRQGWERSELRAARDRRRHDPPPLLVGGPDERWAVRSIGVCDPRAEQVVAELRRSAAPRVLEAAGDVEVWGTSTAGDRSWAAALDRALVAAAAPDGDDVVPLARTAVVVTVSGRGDGHLAGRVRRTHPTVRVVEVGAGEPDDGSETSGRSVTRAALVMDEEPPSTVWRRLARFNHEVYRRSQPAPAAGRVFSRGPWDQGLSTFVQEDNVRQIRGVMTSLSALAGRDWVHLSRVVPGSEVGLTEREWLGVAAAEHERWLRRRLADGWRPGEGPDDDVLRVNRHVVPWEELQDVSGNVAHVRSVVELLAAVSLVPVVPFRGPAAATWYRRTGEVRAERLTEARSWTTESGSPLEGRPGDWLVTDTGGARTVGPDAFVTGYRPTSRPGVYARRGCVVAWQVRDATTVRSREGEVRVPAGGWVVEGVHGERWGMSAHEFADRYEPERTSEGETDAHDT